MENKNIIKNKGFTLIEILITMAITGIVSAAIFTAFQSQQKSYVVQESVAAMQQNLRAGMDMMVWEIRMAGYDPTRDAGAKIEKAESDLIYFTKDDNNDANDKKNSDGDLNDSSEHIVFDLYDSSGIRVLGRTASSSVIDITENPTGHFEAKDHQPLAENIDALEFYYTLADGTQVPIPSGSVPDPTLIRSVQITLLARVDRTDQKFVNTRTYTTPGGQTWGPYNDNFRRRLLTTTVKCRNMGL